jgi:hypothetical protein
MRKDVTEHDYVSTTETAEGEDSNNQATSIGD